MPRQKKTRLPPTLVWIRRDLRIEDNPALDYAVSQQAPVVVLYINNTNASGWQPGAASNWWLHYSLQAFEQSLQKVGARLHLCSGEPYAILETVVKCTGANAIVWNRRYEPDAIALDTSLKSHFKSKGFAVQSFPGNLCHEPWAVMRAKDAPYRVFSAWWKAAAKVSTEAASARIDRITDWNGELPSATTLAELNLLPTLDWAKGFDSCWSPGETGAHAQLQFALDEHLGDYNTGRDLPAQASTSKMSAHLAFGEISPRTILQAAQKHPGWNSDPENLQGFLRQLGWRDFAHHLLYHFPHTSDQPLDTRFEKFPWADAPDLLHAWQHGRTGIPLVDAGMRQLWQTGWMHNRVRMITASLLVKNLGIHWIEGARWFWDTLVDADLANNSMGWQWVAGSGADAAPYFRVFSPTRQGARFDVEGDYVRHWLPELAALPDKFIHTPWLAPDEVLSNSNIELGSSYPAPIVDLSSSRLQALARFDKIKTRAS